MATKEFLEQRIAGRKKEIAKLTKKLARIEKAKSFDWEEEHNPYYYDELDLRSCLEDIEKAKEQLTKYQAELEQQESEDEEIPEAMKKAMNQIIKEWVQDDLKAQEEMFRFSHEAKSYTEFREHYSISRHDFLMHDEEEFIQIETKNAEAWMMDLYNRVKEKTGKITDCSELQFIGKALNGTVKGEKGIATVETITAGGYNIQRLHHRVLVK